MQYRSLSDSSGSDRRQLIDNRDLSVWNESLGFVYDTGMSGFVATPKPAMALALNGTYARKGKRVLDVVLASVAVVLAFPAFLLLALALWAESGNPFFFQERLGQNGRRFRMLKLRSMVRDADALLQTCLENDPKLRAEWDLTQKLKHDPRITPIGRLVRKTSMDELPQLFNVLKGDMSLVGPRPLLPEQMEMYRNPEAYLGVRPGITGLWQVTARNEENFDRRAIMDLRYVQRLSLGSDLRIMGSTFGAVCKATGY